MSYKIILTAFIALTILSCTKENSSQNEASSLKNGTEWSGEVKANTNNLSSSKVDISIDNIRADGFVENLYFFKVPIAKGKYLLSQASNQPPDDSLVGSKFFISADDLLYDVYEIALNDSTSYLEITDYNKEKRELKGEFNLVLWPGWSNSTGAPDSIVFSVGVFHTRIND